jgi:hypothetical protein
LKIADDWAMAGGEDKGMHLDHEEEGSTFFFQKWYNFHLRLEQFLLDYLRRYDDELARFEDIPTIENSENTVKFCPSCVRAAEKKKVSP